MALTTSAANSLLNYMFATKAASTDADKFLWGRYIWIGLFNGDPATAGTEVSASEYNRVLLGQWVNSSEARAASCHMCAASTYTDKSIENVDAIMFDLAESDWGQVTHFGIFGSNSDSPVATGHTLIMSGSLTSSVSINTGYIAMFKKRSGETAGSLKITVT